MRLVGAAGATLLNLQQHERANRLLQDEPALGGSVDHPRVIDPADGAVRVYDQLRDQTLATTIGAYAGLGLSVVAGAAAAVLWIVGEDPERYDR